MDWVCNRVLATSSGFVSTPAYNVPAISQLASSAQPPVRVLHTRTNAPAAAPDVMYAPTFISPDGFRIFLKVSFADTITILQPAAPRGHNEPQPPPPSNFQSSPSLTCTAGS
jgi:hypothetical protein